MVRILETVKNQDVGLCNQDLYSIMLKITYSISTDKIKSTFF